MVFGGSGCGASQRGQFGGEFGDGLPVDIRVPAGDGDGKRGFADDGRFNRRRDRAGVMDVPAQVRPVIDAGDDQIHVTRPSPHRMPSVAQSEGVPLEANAGEPSRKVDGGQPQGLVQGDRMAGRALLPLRGHDRHIADLGRAWWRAKRPSAWTPSSLVNKNTHCRQL